MKKRLIFYTFNNFSFLRKKVLFLLQQMCAIHEEDNFLFSSQIPQMRKRIGLERRILTFTIS